MVEYALLTAGNALGSIQLFATRVVSSIGILEIVLVVAGAWLLWRAVDALFGTRA